MQQYGHKYIIRGLKGFNGAVTVAELLIVLVVSMILLTAVLNGQLFVSQLSRRFFAGAALETEARLLLQTIEQDFTRTEEIVKGG